LALLVDAPRERRAPLEEMVALAEFLSERLPQLRDEWQTHRDQLRATGQLPSAAADQPVNTVEIPRKELPHG
jgi:hypothetical protein